MLRKLALVAAIIAVHANANALTAGDLAFTAFNTDEDGWSLVTFVDIAGNTTIYFNDNEWNGSAVGAGGAFNSGEGYHTWNTGASVIAAGTVVRFTAVDQATRSASVGTFSSTGDSGLNATAETLYAFLGTNNNTPTSFLTAVSTGGFSTANGTLTNTGLTVGSSAVQLTSSTDFAGYTGARSGLSNFAAYKPLVNTSANWFMNVDGNGAAVLPDTTNFSVSAVPEPSENAMLLAGLGLMFFVIRRRLA
ncbi:MAG: PEP-CTERM sorting domain-containing protein [Rhodocyclaceae bacterium]